MRVLVCGGRGFDDYDALATALDAIHDARGIALLIEGGAPGADTLARRWALSRKITFETFKADWQLWGAKVAAQHRNQKMIDKGQPDLVVAFPGGTGTADMIGRAERAGIPVEQPMRGKT